MQFIGVLYFIRDIIQCANWYHIKMKETFKKRISCINNFNENDTLQNWNIDLETFNSKPFIFCKDNHLLYRFSNSLKIKYNLS